MHTATGNPAKSTVFKFLFLSSIWILASATLLIIGEQFGRDVEINWQTETEFNTAGYNIYRSDRSDGNYTKINDSLIPSEGDSTTGANYTFIDKEAPANPQLYYRLEDVEYSGQTKSHPPIVVSSNGGALPLRVLAMSSALIGVFLIILALRNYKVAEKHGDQ